MLVLEQNKDPKKGAYKTWIGLTGVKKRKKSKVQVFCKCGDEKPNKNIGRKYCLLVKTSKK